MKLKKLTIFFSFIFVFMMLFGVKVYAAEDIKISIGEGLNNDQSSILVSYKQEDGTIVSSTTELTFPAGTAVTFDFTILNEEYHMGLWALTTETSSEIIRDTTKSIVQTKFSYKLNKSATIYANFIHKDAFYVAYETPAGKYLAVEEVYQYEDAKGITPPDVKGNVFNKWSETLNDVIYDMVLVPEYKATVWRTFIDFFPQFTGGLGKTLLFSVIAVFFALFLGLLICLMRISKIKPLSLFASAYTEVIRGVPLLLQLLLVYSLMPNFSIGFISVEIFACVLTMFINSSAYLAEIFRSGIQAVDAGQMEAARSLGMSKRQAMIKVILPQAIRNTLPSIGNELIMVIKETSLASSIDMSIGELMSVKNQITAATYINIQAFIVVAIIYFCVTFTLSKVVRMVEKRLADRE